MNTRFLETLVVLARVGSFRETADALHVTQTAVSQRIASLEDDLGIELIDRSSRQLRLTPHGQQVVDQSRKILQLARELKQLAKTDAPVAGPLHIGTVETVVKTWLSPLIEEVTTECPQIDLEITVDTSRNLQALFLAKRVDLMIQDMHFMPAVDSTDYVVRRICDYAMRWIARPGVVDGLSPQQALLELAEHRVLTFSKFSLPHANLQAFLMDHELENVKISNFPSVESILQLLHNGYGVAAIPPVFVLGPIEQGVLHLVDAPAPLPITMQVVTRRAASAAAHEVLRRSISVAHRMGDELNRLAGQQWMVPHFDG